MRRFIIGAIIGSLALIAAAAAALDYFERPTVLRVAIPRDSDDQAILAAATRSFAETHEAIRLKLVPVENLVQSARALEEGHADLAVVRSDLAMPPTGQTVLIMRRNAILFLAPSQSGLHGIDELRGRKIGVLQSLSAGKVDNQQLLDAALTQYDVPLDSVQRVYLTIAEVRRAVVDKKIDALLAVGVPGSEGLTAAVNAIAIGEGDQPVFLPIAEAQAIAQRSPAFEGVEVLRGAFGGAQPKPAMDFETLGVSTRLVARNSLSNEVAGTLTRLILAARPSIAATVPMANRIEAPPSDKGAALPVHPGAIAYLDDEEQKSFLDQYSDMFYIGAMCLSVLGTAIAAAMTKLKRQTAPDTDRVLRRLIELIKAARSAEHMDVLDSCEAEADELLELTLALDMVHGLSPNRVDAIDLALNQLRHVISERRQSLTAPVRAHFVPRIVND
jgi:TRAP transporter TAXI family solute receptor